MDNSESSPVSTLKLDFECSKDCPADVKNMLQQLKGVKAISIDPNQGTVTVEGNVNPMVLIKLIQKMGKTAQLWSFDKAPMKTKADCHVKQEQTSHCCYLSKKQTPQCCCGRSDSEDDSDDVHTPHKARHGQTSKKRHGWKEMFVFGNRKAAAAAAPFTGDHPPMPVYNQPFSGSHYHPAMQWHQSMAYAAPSRYARAVPWYGYYEGGQHLPPTYTFSRPPSKYIPMIHYTSYADNNRYTL